MYKKGKKAGENKYGNIKAHGFDSRKEEARWHVLQEREKAGEISALRRQVPIQLIPAQYIDGKCVERGVKYIADFVYIENGEIIYEDVKSKITRQNREYILKRKLLLYIHNIRLREE